MKRNLPGTYTKYKFINNTHTQIQYYHRLLGHPALAAAAAGHHPGLVGHPGLIGQPGSLGGQPALLGQPGLPSPQPPQPGQPGAPAPGQNMFGISLASQVPTTLIYSIKKF